MNTTKARWIRWLAPAAIAAATLTPRFADAFCGFYVGGADTKLYNNATMVVLMREGTRTVLSMQNNYQGPPENFAMVVPVPIVLQKENVKTLPREVFDHIDRLAAPRLVEYWEQDPCLDLSGEQDKAFSPAPGGAVAAAPRSEAELGVKIEAQFTVGEYEVVVLSASDSLGLDTWLRQNNYKIPDGAEPLLRPYVQGGMKFFVAKVDTSKVRFEKGMAMLSPLRFHYDADTFNLPVRLGLVNSAGTQDLIVHILARGQRYEVANYKNVTIPTNLDVDEKARDQFGAFYAALFDRTLEENPGSVITEYAWDAGTCDPCPSPALDASEIATLGGDALTTASDAPTPAPTPPSVSPPTSPFLAPAAPGAPNQAAPAPAPPPRVQPPPGWRPPTPPWPGQFVLTRIHARYGKDSLGEDLIFRAAPPIMGGREVAAPGPNGKLETGSIPGGVNNFQGRYAIRHPWTGPIACANPRRGIWGGPPAGVQGDTRPKPARDLAFAPRGTVKLASFLQHDVPEIKAKAESPTESAAGEVQKKPAAKSCGACFIGADAASGAKEALVAMAIAAAAIAARKKREREGR